MLHDAILLLALLLASVGCWIGASYMYAEDEPVPVYEDIIHVPNQLG